MLIRKVVEVFKQRPAFELEGAVLEQMVQMSVILNNSYSVQEGRSLNFGVRVKGKKVVAEEEFCLKEEVVKLANICLIVSQFMLENDFDDLANRAVPFVPPNFSLALLHFSSLYLSKYEA